METSMAIHRHCIIVENLTMAYGSSIIQQNLDFIVNQGDIFIIMGGSGCGKSTLLRHLVGLQKPSLGRILYSVAGHNKEAGWGQSHDAGAGKTQNAGAGKIQNAGAGKTQNAGAGQSQKADGKKGESVSFWDTSPDNRRLLMKNMGILYQSGALWSSMTLAENISLPLEEYTNLGKSSIRELASLKLALVGLAGFEDYYPSQISGGMRKRAGLARALALDPEILFFDEPSAGLDPVSARLLDDLILELRESLGATIVVVTHELASIFNIGTNSVFLDPVTKTMIASGNPVDLLETSDDERVVKFLTRGEGRQKV
ncbi:ABC transporter, ATP-binding protein [Desulfamplus magnetovallimortis]|uniref:ABC transporter, ATP-binding protein n=1 Tax=Desulfamplus magnetovallimortis TaxID=1246637 RepID=A0A1W1H657_9BACT|nr:ATP-binding cassette domain-containing protein [Desulfamplus magnetovallimortis]SLM27932.1 ABC transporter, ATP-binding protein [Desulfamplus magnetovallimortis]